MDITVEILESIFKMHENHSRGNLYLNFILIHG